MRSKRGNFTKLGPGIFVIFLFAVAVFLTVAEAEVVSANPDSPDTKDPIATPTSPVFADDSLVLNLMFNENSGTVAQDASKYMNTGTLHNFNWNENSGWTDNAVFGSALKFDGVDDYVNCGGDSSFDVDEVTLSAWIIPYESTCGSGIVGKRPIFELSTCGHVSGKCGWTSTPYLAVGFTNTSGFKRGFYTDTLLSTTEFSFATATYKNGEVKIYLNGQEIEIVKTYDETSGYQTGYHPMSDSLQHTSNDVRIGWNYQKFKGIIDEPRIYNRALTADEIRQQYVLGSTKRIMGAVPQFNWSYYSADNNKENAFQIQVGATENGSNMWNYTSPSTENRWVTYAGTSLSRGITYYARVRVQDNTGAWSDNWARTTFRLNQLPIAENQKAEGQINPTRLTTFTPTLSWNYADLDGDAQAQYQIQVGTAENDNSKWDTTVSSSSASVTYGGSTLSTGVTYYWRVRVHDGYEWSSWLYGGTFGPETDWAQIILYIVVFLVFVAFMYVLGRKMFKHISIRVLKKRIKSKLIKFSKFEEMIFQIRRKEIIPFILIIVCAAAAKFIASEFFVLAVFIITLTVYAWRKYDSRMLVGTALFLLVVCAVLLAKGSENLANDVAIWAYYFLVVGVLGLFIEYLREKKHES